MVEYNCMSYMSKAVSPNLLTMSELVSRIEGPIAFMHHRSSMVKYARGTESLLGTIATVDILLNVFAPKRPRVPK